MLPIDRWNEDPRFMALLGILVIYLTAMNVLLIIRKIKLEQEIEYLIKEKMERNR